MTAAAQTFSHTPIRVRGLLAGLIAQGLQQSRERAIERTPRVLPPTVRGAMSLAGATITFGPGLPCCWSGSPVRPSASRPMRS
jgi:hypothetical protein